VTYFPGASSAWGNAPAGEKRRVFLPFFVAVHESTIGPKLPPRRTVDAAATGGRPAATAFHGRGSSRPIAALFVGGFAAMQHVKRAAILALVVRLQLRLVSVQTIRRVRSIAPSHAGDL